MTPTFIRFEGYAFRGDASLGTDTIIERFISKTVPLDQATDTVVRRYLLPTADSTRETARLIEMLARREAEQ